MDSLKEAAVNALFMAMSMLPSQVLHPVKSLEVRAGIHHRHVHRLTDLFSLLFGGGDNASCFFQRNHRCVAPFPSFAAIFIVFAVHQAHGLGGLSQQPFLFVRSRSLSSYRRALLLSGRSLLLGLTRHVSHSFCFARYKRYQNLKTA